MTREDKIKAFEMRLDGKTFQEIADYFGVTRQAIELSFKPERKPSKPRENFKCIWPGLKKWMLENDVSVLRMFNDIRPYASYLTLYNVMKGKGTLTMDRIKSILNYTGLTFEEAFGEEVPIAGCDKDG